VISSLIGAVLYAERHAPPGNDQHVTDLQLDFACAKGQPAAARPVRSAVGVGALEMIIYANLVEQFRRVSASE
jgi:hypothetical protein